MTSKGCVCGQVFKQPWPGMMRTVYGNHERFESTYFRKFPGYYTTGDGKFRCRVVHASTILALRLLAEICRIFIAYIEEEVAAALKKMKRHKAPSLSGLVAETIQATEDIGTQWIHYLCNGIVKEGCIPKGWKSSMVLPIYKGKGDPMECGSYRGIKLLEHAMKVVERILTLPYLWGGRHPQAPYRWKGSSDTEFGSI